MLCFLPALVFVNNKSKEMRCGGKNNNHNQLYSIMAFVYVYVSTVKALNRRDSDKISRVSDLHSNSRLLSGLFAKDFDLTS